MVEPVSGIYLEVRFSGGDHDLSVAPGRVAGNDSSALAASAADDHIVVSPADLKWGPLPPSFPKGGEVAVVMGDPSKAGPFVILKPCAGRLPDRRTHSSRCGKRHGTVGNIPHWHGKNVRRHKRPSGESRWVCKCTERDGALCLVFRANGHPGTRRGAIHSDLRQPCG